MLKAGISGLFYNVVKDMYMNNNLQLKLGQKLTAEFNSEIEVRQVDTLSPNLFKIYINDLKDIFDEGCDGACLRDFKLNSLMYAGDVIIRTDCITEKS